MKLPAESPLESIGIANGADGNGAGRRGLVGSAIADRDACFKGTNGRNGGFQGHQGLQIRHALHLVRRSQTIGCNAGAHHIVGILRECNGSGAVGAVDNLWLCALLFQRIQNIHKTLMLHSGIIQLRRSIRHGKVHKCALDVEIR